MPPEVRYAQSGDYNIAYQVIGDGPRDLILNHGWVSNIDAFWEQPLWVRYFERLASFARVIQFDKRGTGLSDRVPVNELPTLEERMDDVRAVMDAVGSERAALIRLLRGRLDVRAVRRDLPRAHHGPHHGRRLRSARAGPTDYP